jgi:hypothetical protein
MDAFNEGYFYFSPEHYPAFPPNDPELDELLNDEDFYYVFNEGYETAKKDFLIEKGDILGFIKDYNNLLEKYFVNEVDGDFEVSIEVKPKEFKNYKFRIFDFNEGTGRD